MGKIFTQITVVITFLFIASYTNAATCTSSLIGGNWNDPSIWSCGRVPQCGDEIIIPLGSIVRVNVNINLNTGCTDPTTLRIQGVLTFSANRTLTLPSGSGCVDVALGGTIVPNPSLGSSNSIVIPPAPVWTGSFLSLPLLGPSSLGICGIVLPVELLSFEVETINNDEVTLNWETASERENDYFIVESSKDGNYWQTIEEVKASGTTTSSQKYSIKDKSPFTGKSYYRLSQVDFNGQRNELKFVENEFYPVSYLIYPIPVNKLMFVEGKKLENVSMKIINSVGDVVEVEHFSLGDDKVSYNFSQIPSGVYFLVIDNDREYKKTERIVVVHK